MDNMPTISEEKYFAMIKQRSGELYGENGPENMLQMEHLVMPILLMHTVEWREKEKG